MSYVVIWRKPGTSETERSRPFTGPAACADAHAYAIAKTPPRGFVFHAIGTL